MFNCAPGLWDRGGEKEERADGGRGLDWLNAKKRSYLTSFSCACTTRTPFFFSHENGTLMFVFVLVALMLINTTAGSGLTQLNNYASRKPGCCLVVGTAAVWKNSAFAIFIVETEICHVTPSDE